MLGKKAFFFFFKFALSGHSRGAVCRPLWLLRKARRDPMPFEHCRVCFRVQLMVRAKCFNLIHTVPPVVVKGPVQ